MKQCKFSLKTGTSKTFNHYITHLHFLKLKKKSTVKENLRGIFRSLSDMFVRSSDEIIKNVHK